MPLRRTALALAILATAQVARADDVKVVFDRAVKEHDDGKCESTPVGDRVLCERAAEDFRTVYRASPEALGALRDLAYTERGLGQIASARRDFRELAARAPSDSRPERRAWAPYATREAEALEARVPHLSLHIDPRPTGLVVAIDGVPSTVMTRIELDPGSHRVHADIPGRPAFDALVDLQEHDDKTVEIIFEAGPTPATTPVAVVPPPPPTSTSSPPPPKQAPPIHHSHVAPTVIMLSGGGMAALGLGFGIAAFSVRAGSCDSNKQCSPGALDTAYGLADASTVLFIVGGSVLAAGVVWYFAVPSDSPSSVSAGITLTPRSVGAVVRF